MGHMWVLADSYLGLEIYISGFIQEAGSVLFLALLIAIAYYDFRHHRIPDTYCVAILIFGMVAAGGWGLSVNERVFGGLAVSAGMVLLAVCRPGAFGGGDIKLSAAAGLGLGWRCMLLAFILAVLSAGIYAAYLLFCQREGMSRRFALGPFLCLGLCISFLGGDGLASWLLLA